jgi:hypothetical protein
MTAEELKDALILGVLAFTLWRTMKIELRLSKELMEIERKIDLINVYKADKQ